MALFMLLGYLMCNVLLAWGYVATTVPFQNVINTPTKKP